jgi:catechol 2,3-dioxygenase-like lactoylglutathione lyase family enzyme
MAKKNPKKKSPNFSKSSLLGKKDVVAFLASTDFSRAKAFFGDVLGLKLLSEDGFAIVFDLNGIMLRVVKVHELCVAPYTVLGWHVNNTPDIVKKLSDAGVKFERYRGYGQNKDGVWTAPGGTRIAWFKDPDGNLLSVSDQ